MTRPLSDRSQVCNFVFLFALACICLRWQCVYKVSVFVINVRLFKSLKMYTFQEYTFRNIYEIIINVYFILFMYNYFSEQTLLSSLYEFCFCSNQPRVQISATGPVILTEAFRCFPRCLLTTIIQIFIHLLSYNSNLPTAFLFPTILTNSEVLHSFTL